MRTETLKFGRGNAKLADDVYTFSLPAGHTCPKADLCKSKADRKTGAIRDGRRTRFRCYAATMECRPSVRRARWHNFDQLRMCRTRGRMARLILASLPPRARLVRVHDSGDFFSQPYFDAWLDVARERPESTFYAYVKSVALWVRRLGLVGDGRHPGRIPNVVLTASYGGRDDHLIAEHRLRSATVVFGNEEADRLGLEIDHDDGHAMRHGEDFALLLHGQQPKGSDAAEASRALRDAGWTGYSRKTRKPLPLLT